MRNLDKSEEHKRSAKREQIFRDAFIRNCHKLIAIGYARMNAVSFKTEEEPVITGELVLAMNAAIEASDAPSWANHLVVLDDPSINAPGRRGKRRRRVDIEVVRAERGERPRLQFEAKRLYAKGSVDEYLGPDGMGRFLTGDYAAEHDNAGMLGYVQTGEPDNWAHEIEKNLDENRETYGVTEDGDFQPHHLTPSLDHTYRSKHDRATVGKPITIFHTLLRFN